MKHPITKVTSLYNEHWCWNYRGGLSFIMEERVGCGDSGKRVCKIFIRNEYEYDGG
jgi:hypothetical protein